MNPGDVSWIRSSSYSPHRVIFNKDYRRAPGHQPRGMFWGSLFDSRALKESAYYEPKCSKKFLSVCGLSRLEKDTAKYVIYCLPGFPWGEVC